MLSDNRKFRLNKMDKKYELTDETIRYKGRTLHRIRALKDFGDVRANEAGGFVESEANLSQEGDCWVADNAKVMGNAHIIEDAYVADSAEVYGSAIVRGSSGIYNLSKVYGSTLLSGNSDVAGAAKLSGGVWVEDSVFFVPEVEKNSFFECFKSRKKDLEASVKHYHQKTPATSAVKQEVR